MPNKFSIYSYSNIFCSCCCCCCSQQPHTHIPIRWWHSSHIGDVQTYRRRRMTRGKKTLKFSKYTHNSHPLSPSPTPFSRYRVSVYIVNRVWYLRMLRHSTLHRKDEDERRREWIWRKKIWCGKWKECKVVHLRMCLMPLHTAHSTQYTQSPMYSLCRNTSAKYIISTSNDWSTLIRSVAAVLLFKVVGSTIRYSICELLNRCTTTVVAAAVMHTRPASEQRWNKNRARFFYRWKCDEWFYWFSIDERAHNSGDDRMQI